MSKSVKAITIGDIASGRLAKSTRNARNSIVLNGKRYNKNRNSSEYYLNAAAAQLEAKNMTSRRRGRHDLKRGEELAQASVTVMDAIGCTVELSMKKNFLLYGDNNNIKLNNDNIDNKAEWDNAKNSKRSIVDRFPNPNDPIYEKGALRSTSEQNRVDERKQLKKSIRTVAIAADLARVNLDPAFRSNSKYFENM